MRNGKKTGSPVSAVIFVSDQSPLFSQLAQHIPGCRVASTIFFALHRSGVMKGILFCLYWAITPLACSKPAGPVSSVLKQQISNVFTEAKTLDSPRVGNVCGMANTAPVGSQIILRDREVTGARNRGRHGANETSELHTSKEGMTPFSILRGVDSFFRNR